MTAKEAIRNKFKDAFEGSSVLSPTFWYLIEGMMEDYAIEKIKEVEGINTINPETMIRMVCQEFNVPRDSINSLSRKKNIITARHVSFYFMVNFLNMTQQEAANLFQQNHATVWNALTKVAGYVYTDKIFRAKIERIEKRLNSILNNDE